MKATHKTPKTENLGAGGRGAMRRRFRAETVTPSCGCVFCDLDDVPEMVNGALKHHYQGRDGRMVPCTKR